MGKTELTKALAEFLFGSEEAMTQLDMTEFTERHTVSRLVGAPPGYVGFEEAGQLTEALRRRPYSIVVFDEIEKAHTEALNILLQIMEEGRLTDARGHKVDFRNAMIVMTSNIGAETIRRQATLGFGQQGEQPKGEVEPYEEMRKKLLEELRRAFRPEFLNRVDAIIVFRALEKRDITQIVELELLKVANRLADHHISLQASPEAKVYLADQGYNPEMGARPLRRVIQTEVEDRLSEALLAGQIRDGDSVTIQLREDTIVLETARRRRRRGRGRTAGRGAPRPVSATRYRLSIPCFSHRGLSKMIRKKTNFGVLLLMAALFAACSSPAATPTEPAETEAAKTMAVILTQISDQIQQTAVGGAVRHADQYADPDHHAHRHRHPDRGFGRGRRPRASRRSVRRPGPPPPPIRIRSRPGPWWASATPPSSSATSARSSTDRNSKPIRSSPRPGTSATSGCAPGTGATSCSITPGQHMNGPHFINFPEIVAPNQSTWLSVTLTAPKSAGPHIGRWYLQDPDGIRFGVGVDGDEPLIVDINVVL